MESRIALIMTQIQQVKEQIKLQKADEKFQTQAGAALEYLNPYFPNKLHKLMLLTYTEAA